MDDSIFYTDVKESIIRNFSFLKLYGFKDFSENQRAYELHFETQNDFVSIDIWMEAISSSPLWIKINQYYLDNIEPENLILKNCEKLRKEKYHKLFQLYLETDDEVYLDKIQKRYVEKGKEINETYLKECSNILKRNLNILTGDFEKIKLNTEKILQRKEQLKAEEKIKNKIYILEYQLFPNGSINDAYEEFSSFQELIHFIKERDDIKNYRILDWNGKEIKEN